ncbi:MAG: protease SohB [Gammaproteobacteria bacterium]
MEFISDYGLFFAKTVTVVFLPMLAMFWGLALLVKLKPSREEHIEVKHLNQKFETMSLSLQAAMLPKKAFKHVLKQIKMDHKKDEKRALQDSSLRKKNVFVLSFKGDVQASAVSSLREEITAILMVAGPGDEVILRLESMGGVVHGYGLAASQLKRIRDGGIPLTVAIDHIAASGGYMMACVADRIIAAPFAVIGSIGVVGQLPNFNRMLKNYDIDFELHTAGEYKRTLTLFGENTEKNREKFRADLEEIHALFKHFVQQNRPQVEIAQVATGEYWYGTRAMELKLVDELRTSDDYVRKASEAADVFEVTYKRKKTAMERLVTAASAAIKR